MPDIEAGWIVAIITTVGAITVGFFTYRGSRAQAQPDAQASINAGFTALSDRQAVEIRDLRREVEQIKRTAVSAELKAEHADDEAESARMQAADMRQQMANLTSHVKATTNWHVRHIPFDERAKQIIDEAAPDAYPPLPQIEPFPELPHGL